MNHLPQPTTPVSQATPAVQSRWARPNPVQLVNTSLPAREAIPLVPGTLASLTRNPNAQSVPAPSIPSMPNRSSTSEPYRRPGARSSAAVPSAEEFPSLGSLKTALPKKEPTRSYADMSREWVKAAKEKEEEDKKRAEEERSLETPEEVFRHRVISLVPLNASSTSTSTSTRKEYDGIGGSKEEWSDESDLSDPHVDTEVLSPSDEDSDEFNSNIVWDRRSKNEMY
jgi:hypothetical protein